LAKTTSSTGDALDPQCSEVEAFAQMLIETIESAADRLEALHAASNEFGGFEELHQVSCARCQAYVTAPSGADLLVP
jgi:hypothetical protein